jgi:two-component system LytT family response regulator
MIPVVIVDDERPARDGLRVRLEEVPDFKVVGEAASGRTAIAAVMKHAPALLFLDISLPDMNGFEALLGIPAARRPHVIFVTAHDEHALRAFEVHALDYLLKPIVSERFDAAIALARTMHAQRLASRKLEELASALGGSPAESRPAVADGTLDRLLLRDGARTHVVLVPAIRWIEACGNYVTIHTAEKELLHRITLTRMERQLPPRAFARIHRSAIVNVAEIADIRRSAHGDGDVTLRDGSVVPLSRRYWDALK